MTRVQAMPVTGGVQNVDLDLDLDAEKITSCGQNGLISRSK